MIVNLLRSRFFCPLGAVSIIIGMTLSTTAHQPAPAPVPVDAMINSVAAFQITDESKRPTGWAVFVEFNQNFDPVLDKKDENRSNFRIIDVNSGAFVSASEARFVVVRGLTVSRIRLVVPDADSLDKDGLYHLFAFNLTFQSAAAEDPFKLQHPVKFMVESDQNMKVRPKVDETATAEIAPHAPPKAAWGLKASKGRDDSDLYGSYELTKARGIATTGTGDLKVGLPFFKTFWKRTSRFSPLVDIKVSSDANADPDSLKLAVEWFLPVHVGNNPEARFPYTAVDLISSGKIEAPKNFNNINALWESKWLFPSSHFPWSGKKFRMFLDPFVGHELGKNLKSPLKDAEGKGIARLMVGANLTIQVPVRNLVALKGFEFTSSYIRRWPLKRELLVDKDDNGNLVLLTLSKGPKDYSDSKFIIKINDYFGPYIGYEWGRLPPNYELVDHKWTFGILFKSKVRAGGQ